MKVRELLRLLEKADLDSDVVVQKNFEEGYAHYDIMLQLSGHPGHDGPVIHIYTLKEDLNEKL